MPKNNRIELRISDGMKKEILMFARLKGMTLSEFLISCVYKCTAELYKQPQESKEHDKNNPFI